MPEKPVDFFTPGARRAARSTAGTRPSLCFFEKYASSTTVGVKLGFEFTVSSNRTITSLGVYDSGANGLSSNAQIGIWDTSGNLLTSTTILAGTGQLDGLFRYVNISGFSLVAGTHYAIGAYTTDLASSLNTLQGGSGSIDPDVDVIVDRYSAFNSIFSFPTQTDGHADGAWLGANFRTGATGSVPEPASLALIALGLLGIGVARQRKS